MFTKSRNIRLILKSIINAKELDAQEVANSLSSYLDIGQAITKDERQAMIRAFIEKILTSKPDVIRQAIKATPRLVPLYYASSAEKEIYRDMREKLDELDIKVKTSNLKMSKKQSAGIKKQYEMDVKKRMSNKDEYSASSLHDIVSGAIDSKGRTRPQQLLIASTLLTGARPNEVLDPSIEFEVVDDSTFTQQGVSKARGRDGAKDLVTKDAIILSAPETVELINKTREAWAEFMDANGPSRKTMGLVLAKVNRIVKKLFDKKGDTIMVFRKIYANYAEAKYRKPTEDIDVYISRVLGHSAGDTTTAKSYKTVHINMDK